MDEIIELIGVNIGDYMLILLFSVWAMGVLDYYYQNMRKLNEYAFFIDRRGNISAVLIIAYMISILTSPVWVTYLEIRERESGESIIKFLYPFIGGLIFGLINILTYTICKLF